MSDYFSDRETGPKPQFEELITTTAWGGIVALVDALIDQGAFGYDFPETCPDGGAVIGTNSRAFGLAVQAEIPGLVFPLQPDRISELGDEIYSIGATLMAVDFVEFCHRHVSHAVQVSYHDFFRHHHLSFEREAGQSAFRERINRIFLRNRIAFSLSEDGTIRRLLPTPIRVIRHSGFPLSGESTLDDLINQSLSMFSTPDPSVRKDALDKLWDAWERLKTVEKGNKKQSSERLLAMAAASGQFADLLQEEANKLTAIGNSFHIRHTETNKEPLTEPKHVDYLYARLLSLVYLLLTARNEAVNE